MSKVLIENSTLANIAEAIRNKSENNSQMLPSEMPEHILNIDTGKVTIDGEKVTEKMELYSYFDTYREYSETKMVNSYLESSSYNILNNKDILKISQDTKNKVRTYTFSYIDKNTDTIIKTGSFQFDYSNYNTIELTEIYQDDAEIVWFIIMYKKSSDAYRYFAVYQLELNNDTINIIQKCKDVQTLYSQMSGSYGVSGKPIFGFLVDSTGLYVAERELLWTGYNSSTVGGTNCTITNFNFNNNNNNTKVLQAISTPQTYQINDSFYDSSRFTKINNSYYLFYRAGQANQYGVDSFIKITQDSNNNFIEERKTLILDVGSIIKFFTYNNTIYSWYSNNKQGAVIYKLINDIQWEMVETIQTSNYTYLSYKILASRQPWRIFQIIEDTDYFFCIIYECIDSPENNIKITTPILKGFYGSRQLLGWKYDDQYIYIYTQCSFHGLDQDFNEYEKLTFELNNKSLLFSKIKSETV